jgi:hypothetical protein
MPLTDVGKNFIAQAVMNDSPTFFNNANAFLGVGDSATGFAANQTDLQAASNKLRKAMATSFPQRNANVITFRSVFGTADANFAWNEWGVFNAGSSGTMLSRKVESLGTKNNAQSWQFDATLTFQNP